MSTSGWWRASCDLDVVCKCGSEGTVPAVEDIVQGVPVCTWVCPECGHEEDELK